METTPQPRSKLSRLVIASLLDVIQIYRRILSPFYGTQCRFQPTCSVYAEQALLTHGVRKGLRLTLNRLRRCHPIKSLGASDGFTYDPVPPHYPATPTGNSA